MSVGGALTLVSVDTSLKASERGYWGFPPFEEESEGSSEAKAKEDAGKEDAE